MTYPHNNGADAFIAAVYLLANRPRPEILSERGLLVAVDWSRSGRCCGSLIGRKVSFVRPVPPVACRHVLPVLSKALLIGDLRRLLSCRALTLAAISQPLKRTASAGTMSNRFISLSPSGSLRASTTEWTHWTPSLPYARLRKAYGGCLF